MDTSTLAPLTPNAWLRYELIKDMFPPGISDVLEIGCGQGALGTRLAQRFNYLGVEPDQVSWAIASKRIRAAGGRGEVRNIPVQDLGDERFDLVCAFEVLEHIEDDAAAVKEWSSRLRAPGWLLLSVPAHQDRYGPVDELVGHYRRYDPAAMTALLAGCGFTGIQVRQYGFPLGHLLEAGRNLIARRRLASAAATSVAERTAGSGRLLQPSGGPARGRRPLGDRALPGGAAGVPKYRDRPPGPRPARRQPIAAVDREPARPRWCHRGRAGTTAGAEAQGRPRA